MSDKRAKRVAVIGGGITGLATSYYLARAGAEVTVLEASDRLGGLGAYFEYDGLSLERHYHVMLPSDGHLLPLLDELGLGGQVYWCDSKFAFLRSGSIYPLNSALDLLRFRPVPFLGRIRLGLTSLYASYLAKPGPLDDITVEEWLTRCSGRRAFAALWKPLLEAKFGGAYRDVPALWYWSRFNREKGTEKEVKGYIRGGYRRISDTLAAALRGMAAKIETEAPVEHLDLSASGRPVLRWRGASKEFDSVVCTLPMVQTRQVTRGGRVEEWLGSGPDIDYQGVINVLVMLRRSAYPYYWTAVMDPEVVFRGIVETTRCVDLSETGGRHLVYLLNYVHRSDPLFSRSDSDLAAHYVRDFMRLTPHLDQEDILDVHVFRSPFVEPLYSVGYLRRKPPHELVPSRVYLANSAQVYPEVTSWNSSVGLARRTATQVLANTGQVSCVEAA